MPDATSAARARTFNEVSVSAFFDILEKLQDEKKFTPDRICNVDETGISTVPNNPSRIIAPKGKKQVGCLSSAERGQLVPAEICMSAARGFVPPMVAPAATGVDLATDINGNDNGIGSPRRNQNATSVAITTVSPIPKVTEQTPRKSHRRGKTCIITLSPYKQELEQTESQVVQGSATAQHERNHPRKQTEVSKQSYVFKQDDTACLYCCEQFVNSRKGGEMDRVWPM